MLEELKKILAGIRRDTQRLLDNTLKSYLQIARYDVTTEPNGTVIGVTRPFSDTEIQIPYLHYCANAAVGDTVLVVWWGSLTNAQAWLKLPAVPGAMNLFTVTGYGDAWDRTPTGGVSLYHRSGRNEAVLTLRWSDTSGMQISAGFDENENLGIWYRGRTGTSWTGWVQISAS